MTFEETMQQIGIDLTQAPWVGVAAGLRRVHDAAVLAEREANKIPREIIIKNDRYSVKFLDDGDCEVVWIGPCARKD